MKRSEYVEKKENFWWKYVERPKRIIGDVWNKIWGMDIDKVLKMDVDNHRFELVIMPYDGGKIVRLLGLGMDEDYYYVAQNIDGSIYYCTCVGGFTPLIDSMDKFTYYRMEYLWDRNMEKSVEDVFKELKNKDKVITY